MDEWCVEVSGCEEEVEEVERRAKRGEKEWNVCAKGGEKRWPKKGEACSVCAAGTECGKSEQFWLSQWAVHEARTSR